MGLDIYLMKKNGDDWTDCNDYKYDGSRTPVRYKLLYCPLLDITERSDGMRLARPSDIKAFKKWYRSQPWTEWSYFAPFYKAFKKDPLVYIEFNQ